MIQYHVDSSFFFRRLEVEKTLKGPWHPRVSVFAGLIKIPHNSHLFAGKVLNKTLINKLCLSKWPRHQITDHSLTRPSIIQSSTPKDTTYASCRWCDFITFVSYVFFIIINIHLHYPSQVCAINSKYEFSKMLKILLKHNYFPVFFLGQINCILLFKRTLTFWEFYSTRTGSGLPMVYFLTLSQHYEIINRLTSDIYYFIIDNDLSLIYVIKQTLAYL